MISESNTGPFTAHTCAESSHYRDEANRLRDLLRQLEASNESLAAQVSRLTRERDEAREELQVEQRLHHTRPDVFAECGRLTTERDTLRTLLGEATAAILDFDLDDDMRRLVDLATTLRQKANL